MDENPFQFKRKLYQIGGSNAVNVPKPVLCSLNASTGDELTFTANASGEIVIRKKKEEWE